MSEAATEAETAASEEAVAATEVEATSRNRRRVVTGLVTSDKMDKTIKVEIQRYITHPIYEKRLRRSTVYTVHDEKNEAKSGDTVEIMETRKLSKTKTWRLVSIVKQAAQ